MEKKPTLRQLNHLERMDGKSPVKIIESIGGKYDELCTHLLDDDDGNIMDTIKQDHPNMEDRTRAIFTKWLRESKGPVTWKVLIDNLRKVGLNALANDVTEALAT